jgi:hypothetical protein
MSYNCNQPQRQCPQPPQPIYKSFTVNAQPHQAQPQQIFQKVIVREGAKQRPAPVYQTIYVEQPPKRQVKPIIHTQIIRERAPCAEQQPQQQVYVQQQQLQPQPQVVYAQPQWQTQAQWESYQPQYL